MDFVIAVATQAWWQSLLAFVWTLFMDIGVPVLTTLVLVLVAKWTHLSITTSTERLIRSKVFDAIVYADQKLKKALDEGDAPKDKNAARMQWAKSFLEQALATSKLDKKVTNMLEDLIEAHLGSIRPLPITQSEKNGGKQVDEKKTETETKDTEKNS